MGCTSSKSFSKGQKKSMQDSQQVKIDFKNYYQSIQNNSAYVIVAKIKDLLMKNDCKQEDIERIKQDVYRGYVQLKQENKDQINQNVDIKEIEQQCKDHDKVQTQYEFKVFLIVLEVGYLEKLVQSINNLYQGFLKYLKDNKFQENILEYLEQETQQNNILELSNQFREKLFKEFEKKLLNSIKQFSNEQEKMISDEFLIKQILTYRLSNSDDIDLKHLIQIAHNWGYGQNQFIECISDILKIFQQRNRSLSSIINQFDDKYTFDNTKKEPTIQNIIQPSNVNIQIDEEIAKNVLNQMIYNSNYIQNNSQDFIQACDISLVCNPVNKQNISNQNINEMLKNLMQQSSMSNGSLIQGINAIQKQLSLSKQEQQDSSNQENQIFSQLSQPNIIQQIFQHSVLAQNSGKSDNMTSNLNMPNQMQSQLPSKSQKELGITSYLLHIQNQGQDDFNLQNQLTSQYNKVNLNQPNPSSSVQNNGLNSSYNLNNQLSKHDQIQTQMKSQIQQQLPSSSQLAQGFNIKQYQLQMQSQVKEDQNNLNQPNPSSSVQNNGLNSSYNLNNQLSKHDQIQTQMKSQIQQQLPSSSQLAQDFNTKQYQLQMQSQVKDDQNNASLNQINPSSSVQNKGLNSSYNLNNQLSKHDQIQTQTKSQIQQQLPSSSQLAQDFNTKQYQLQMQSQVKDDQNNASQINLQQNQTSLNQQLPSTSALINGFGQAYNLTNQFNNPDFIQTQVKSQIQQQNPSSSQLVQALNSHQYQLQMQNQNQVNNQTTQIASQHIKTDLYQENPSTSALINGFGQAYNLTNQLIQPDQIQIQDLSQLQQKLPSSSQVGQDINNKQFNFQVQNQVQDDSNKENKISSQQSKVNLPSTSVLVNCFSPAFNLTNQMKNQDKNSTTSQIVLDINQTNKFLLQ
ncbi:hypothetical protein ABPG74_018713 [Tetrahymena malaccensis]